MQTHDDASLGLGFRVLLGRLEPDQLATLVALAESEREGEAEDALRAAQGLAAANLVAIVGHVEAARMIAKAAEELC